jgi:RNA polymerase sigma factor (sigma-70 family)
VIINPWLKLQKKVEFQMHTEEKHTTFEGYYALYHLEIFRQALGHTGNRQDAEDITQEVFLRLLKGLHKANGNVAYVRNWLHTVCTNACIDLSRKRIGLHKQHINVSLSAIVGEETEDFLIWLQAADFTEDVIRKYDVERTLNMLEEQDAAYLLRLHHVQGYPCKEIGHMFGTNETTIKARVYRARREFRATYEKVAS